MKQIEFYVESTLDGTSQPSLFFPVEAKEKRPLMVGLHTWSCERHNQVPKLLPLAEKLGFNLLLPEFRGPNLKTNPKPAEACGSELAKRDILDAIDYVLSRYEVDSENIFLVGGSGGGHMALLMAGYAPERFKAIVSVVPITNLVDWKDQNANYTEHILACTGGEEAEMLMRSPISYVDEIARANLKIFHGKWDKSVPVSHSIGFYNELIARHPTASVYLDVFDGGHEMCIEAVELFISKQYKRPVNENLTG